MADSIDMSLDDIIKKGKSSGGGFRSGGRFGRRGGDGASRGQKRTFQRPSRGARNTNRTPYERGNIDGTWTHDLFDGPKRGGFERRGDTGGSSTKLNISNLDFEVLDSDLYELFSEFGTLKKASVHFDRSGRSLGTADVIFEKRSDALRAMKQYDQVPLDGREMSIQLAEEASGSRPGRGPVTDRLDNFRRSSGGRVDKFNRRPRESNRGQRGRRNGGGGGEGRRGDRGDRKPQVSKEDLDKELDAYLGSR